MGRSNKIFILMLAMLLGVFLLTGCNKNGNASDGGNSKKTVVPDDNQNNSSDVSSDSSDTSSEGEPAADDELSIYTVDTQEGSGDIIPVTAIITEGDKITPEFIVEKVVESLADQAITIDTPEVTQEKTATIVNFKKNAAPYNKKYAEYEENILNAFAQSLIDNLEDYDKVIFRVEGKPYKSANFKFGLNQAFMEK